MDEASGRAGERVFRFADVALQDVAELAGVLLVQSEVRVLFHDIQGVAEIGGGIRIGFGVQHRTILQGAHGRFIDFLKLLYAIRCKAAGPRGKEISR